MLIYWIVKLSDNGAYVFYGIISTELNSCGKKKSILQEESIASPRTPLWKLLSNLQVAELDCDL